MFIQLLLITLAVIVGIIAAPYLMAYPVIAVAAIAALALTSLLYRTRQKGKAH